MLLLEHNGKALLRKHGIPTPHGVVVGDAATLLVALHGLPEHLVLKAQIVGGGRGRSGGIAFTTGHAEALAAFDALCSNRINGHAVDTVLVEERIPFAEERYAGVLIEDGEIRLLFARRGGIDIEDITTAEPAQPCARDGKETRPLSALGRIDRECSRGRGGRTPHSETWRDSKEHAQLRPKDI